MKYRILGKTGFNISDNKVKGIYEKYVMEYVQSLW